MIEKSLTDTFDIRPWRDGDEIRLTGLFQRAFGRPISTDHWRWKLRPRTHPFENVWIAFNGDEPVFQYAGIPIRFKLDNTEVAAVVSVDTMTAPEFRRRGLLTRVAGQAYCAWRNAGTAFVIGLPNENWGSRARALGWKPLFPLQWLVRPLRPEVILRWRLGWPAAERLSLLGTVWNAMFARRLRPSPDIRVTAVSEASRDFDQIWDGARSSSDFSTVRDRSWIDWRFLASPSRRYEVSIARRGDQPCGYVCHSLLQSGARKSGYLAEFLCAASDDETRTSLLAHLLARLNESGAESVHALAIPGTTEFSCLRAAGFIPRESFGVEIVPLRADLPLDRLRDPSRWHLTGADFDVV